MSFFSTRTIRLSLLLIPALAIGACGSDGGPSGVEDPPVITITGVADSVTYPGAVTINVNVDKGSYSTTLDGAAVNSPVSVQAPGSHTLVVTARMGDVTATRTVRFTIQGAEGGMLIIRMFDLGSRQEDAPGDAILITDSTSAGMMHVLVDAGSYLPTQSGAYVSSQLSALGVDSLAVAILTHAHGDHYLGMSSVLTNQKVRRFIYNGQIRSLSSYTNMLAQAQVSADSMIKITTQRDYNLGYSTQPAKLKVLPPLPNYINVDTGDGTLLNEGSVGARLELGTFDMFFTGDSEVEATARWRTTFSSFTSDLSILKVGHHGANNAIFDNGFSGQSTWMDHTSPNVSIISANGTSHPRINALTRIMGQPDNRVYCTNVHGNITIRVTRAGIYTVTTQKNANSNCVPGSTATT